MPIDGDNLLFFEVIVVARVCPAMKGFLNAYSNTTKGFLGFFKTDDKRFSEPCPRANATRRQAMD
jgi:hypothetical protein